MGEFFRQGNGGIGPVQQTGLAKGCQGFDHAHAFPGFAQYQFTDAIEGVEQENGD